MTLRIIFFLVGLAVLFWCGCSSSANDAGGTAGAGGDSGGTGGFGGSAGAAGFASNVLGPAPDKPGVEPGDPCGPPLSAPTRFTNAEELDAMVIGAWLYCDEGGFSTPEGVGIELRADHTVVELFERDGNVVRSADERPWMFWEHDETGDPTLVVVDGSSYDIFWPERYEPEGQLVLRDRRLYALAPR